MKNDKRQGGPRGRPGLRYERPAWPFLTLVKNVERANPAVVSLFGKPCGRCNFEAVSKKTEPLSARLKRLRRLENTFSIPHAARILNIRTGLLLAIMGVCGWIYRRRSGPWMPYHRTLHLRLLQHNPPVLVWDEDGKIANTCLRITAKGLKQLLGLVNHQGNQEGQGS